jgi:hypothetical protein
MFPATLIQVPVLGLGPVLHPHNVTGEKIRLWVNANMLTSALDYLILFNYSSHIMVEYSTINYS